MVTSKFLNQKLIAAFPELERPYRDQTEWQEGDDTGSHVVYGDVLVPVILALLKAGDRRLVKKYFDFLESLLATGDDYAIDVVATTVIESIVLDRGEAEEVKPLLGEASLKIWEGYEQWRRSRPPSPM